MSTAIVCLGNELVGDDGAGACAGRILSSIHLPFDVMVVTRPNLGIDILDLLVEHEHVVVADAMSSGRQPGTIVTLEMAEAARMAVPPGCAHCIGIPELVQLARRIAPDRSSSCLRVVAIEGAELNTFGVGLSQAVRRAFPEFMRAVLQAAGIAGTCDAEAAAAVARELATSRGVADVLRG